MLSKAHWRFEHESPDTPMPFVRERPSLTLSSPNTKLWKEHTQSSRRERLSTLHSQIGCLSDFNVVLSNQERRAITTQVPGVK